MKLAFLVSGRGTNLKALIAACHSGQVQAEPALVIADRPQAGALQIAASAGVTNLLINAHDYSSRSEHERAIAHRLHEHHIDLVILAGYQRLLSPFLVGYLYEPGLGQSRILNIHPADTRRYQGLNGYAWALKEGLNETAVTVHYVDEGMDTGKIVAQAPLPMYADDTLESLQERGLKLEHQLFPQATQKVIEELQQLCAAF
ncbi:MAG: phosphoribosylglycinamide formyltransferase [Candidatus Eremiobacteraeota bacterium]|nr:phosphoribosylglycinamide formyltransferase [Candidatus Eremiobacteraeota bacterium]MCW5872608.1 phosphoribosylglycinamide formyltransferase [Candidatus Eremiobacteraeota bacterium]